MLRYAITDRRRVEGSESDRMAAILEQAVRLARSGVDYLQLREKDLAPPALLEAACKVRKAIASSGMPMKLIVNGPVSVAVEAGADGLHVSAAQGEEHVRAIAQTARQSGLLVSLACHTIDEVARMHRDADLILFAPIFGKEVAGQEVVAGVGLLALERACVAAHGVPVLALGGVSQSRIESCLRAGAAGVAAIRLFLSGSEPRARRDE